MSLFKKKLTEQEAAFSFILYLTKETQDAWPTIKKGLEDTFKESFIVTKEDIVASYDLALAAIAQDLQALKNIFPTDQAERIEKWIFKCIDTENWGEYAVDEVKKYSEKFQKGVENIEVGGDPLSAIPGRLLYRWLGQGLKNFEVEINGKKTGVISPVLLSITMRILASFAGTWKRITDKFELTEGELPFDFFDKDAPGLNDYKPEPEKKKPDGTIQYYDKHGNLKETWLPLEQIKEFLKNVGAKRVYKVLVKGPWEGIKEGWWELSDDVFIKKFVDEKNYAYAIANYEKGELKYHFVTKRLWVKQEQMEKIFMDQNLSPEQQKEAVKKLMID